MSLTYNRSLFTAAGLDPDTPPTTWDEVRAAAKTIAEKTGVAGYAQMATENTGGWQLTTSTYALGGRMEEVGADGKVDRDRQQRQDQGRPPAAQGRCAGRTTAWAPRSTTRGARSNQAYAAGQVGMFTGGSDLYTWMIQNAALKPDDYGITVLPLDGADAGVLGGGTLAAVNVVTTEAERDAAVNWIDFYYIQKLITEEGAVADAKALTANNQPVGVPALPIFDKATYDESAGLDQGLHQRPHGPDDPVHLQDLRAAARQRAGRPHPGALRGPRPRRAGRPHRPERRHQRPA